MPLATSGRGPVTKRKSLVAGRSSVARLQTVLKIPQQKIVSRSTPPTVQQRRDVVIPFQRVAVPEVRQLPTQRVEDIATFLRPQVAPPSPLVNLTVAKPPNALIVSPPLTITPPVTIGEPKPGLVERVGGVITAGKAVIAELESLPETIKAVREGVKALPGELEEARTDLQKAAQLRDMMIVGGIILAVFVLLK